MPMHLGQRVTSPIGGITHTEQIDQGLQHIAHERTRYSSVE